MVERRKKSRTLRRISVKTPGGKTVMHYKERKPKVAHCSKCRAVLKGIPRARPIRMATLTKSKKRPSRPYAGVLCSRCLRAKIVDETRK